MRGDMSEGNATSNPPNHGTDSNISAEDGSADSGWHTGYIQ